MLPLRATALALLLVLPGAALGLAAAPAAPCAPVEPDAVGGRGCVRWNQTYAHEAGDLGQVSTSLAVSDARVAHIDLISGPLTARGADLVVADAATGELLWRTPLVGGGGLAFTSDGAQLLRVASEDGRIVLEARDAAAGGIAWRLDAGAGSDAGLVLDPASPRAFLRVVQRLDAFDTALSLRAIDLAQATVLWDVPLVASGVSYFAGVVPQADSLTAAFATRTGSALPHLVTAGFDPETGAPIWSTDIVAPEGSALSAQGLVPLDAQRVALLASESVQTCCPTPRQARVVAFDVATGDVAWDARWGEAQGIPLPSEPSDLRPLQAIAHDGVLYVSATVSNDARVFALDGQSGRISWSASPGFGILRSLAVADGRLLLAGGTGQHVALALRATDGLLLWRVETPTALHQDAWAAHVTPDGARAFVAGSVWTPRRAHESGVSQFVTDGVVTAFDTRAGLLG